MSEVVVKKEKPEHADDHPEAIARRRARMRDDWNNLIDDLIEEGRQQGAFDNLPGKGKPLNLKKRPYAQDWELAHNLLKRNDMAPAWIMERNKLLEAIQALRAEIEQTWAWHEQAYRLAQGEGQQGALVVSWYDACQAWESQIVELNKQIDTFNLKRPSDHLEIFKPKLEEELARVGARRWLR